MLSQINQIFSESTSLLLSDKLLASVFVLIISYMGIRILNARLPQKKNESKENQSETEEPPPSISPRRTDRPYVPFVWAPATNRHPAGIVPGASKPPLIDRPKTRCPFSYMGGDEELISSMAAASMLPMNLNPLDDDDDGAQHKEEEEKSASLANEAIKEEADELALTNEERAKELELKKLQLENIYKLLRTQEETRFKNLMERQADAGEGQQQQRQRDFKFSVLNEHGEYVEQDLKENFEDQLKLYGL